MKKDYCSFSPDTIMGVDISKACERHDYYYAKADNKIATRYEADCRLRDDIIKIGKNKFLFVIVAWIYFIAVRIGGYIYEW